MVKGNGRHVSGEYPGRQRRRLSLARLAGMITPLLVLFLASFMPLRPAALPVDEAARLSALAHLRVLDSIPEATFDDVVLLATTLCHTPIGLVSLVDKERQWFKACLGLDATQTHRDLAFCAHAILKPDEVLVVENALLDPRFRESPLVLGPPFIRFYAGAPIVTPEGFAVGTVCVIDTVPRTLAAQTRRALQALARQTAAMLQLRLLSEQRESTTADLVRQLDQVLNESPVAQQALQRVQRVSSLASIAHDFNNLLQAVSASLQMIRLKALKPLEVERLSGIGLQAVAQGGELIRHLLAFARREAPDLQCVDVSPRLEAGREVFKRVAGSRIALQFELMPGPAHVRCDASQLEAVVLNLLINAKDALQGQGTVRINSCFRVVSGDPVLADGDYLELSVADAGAGMSPDVASRVFEPFYTTKGLGKGTGLGLAQVYGFAVNAGGVARIHSIEGQGTTVTLLLKIVAADS